MDHQGTVARHIRGIHANWVAPRLHNARRQGWTENDLRSIPALAAHDLLTLIFSALAWRKHHGPLALYADSRTIDFLGARGLLDLYDECHSAEIDGIDQDKFDPDVYFALPKLVALRASSVPVAVLDVDLFLRVALPPLGPKEFGFAHFETLSRDVYPLLAQLPNPNGLELPGWNDDIPACNMAIGAFTHQPHLDEFTDLALAYAVGNGGDLPMHPVARIAFAEQRLCAYTASRHGVVLRPVTTSTWDAQLNQWSDGSPEHLFHHTWHQKRYIDRRQVQERLYSRVVAELLDTFPAAEALLACEPTFSRYVATVRSGSPATAP